LGAHNTGHCISILTKTQDLLRDTHLQKLLVSYCYHPMTILVMYAAPSHICTPSILPCTTK